MVNMQIVTKKLIILSAITIVIISLIFGATLIGEKLMISWLCILCGISGGFVSIQQRTKKFSNRELELLSTSFFQILLIPIYGGIFSLLLYGGFYKLKF